MLITRDMIISGFVSKAVNDYVDRKKDANKDKKSNKQSKETRTYQVTIDALNELTKNKYEGQDILCDAAENILKGLKNNQDDKIEAVRVGLKMLVPQVTSDTCKDFLGTLCHEICKDKNSDLYKEIVMFWQEQTNGNLKEITQNQEEGLGMLEGVKEDTRYIREVLEGKEANRSGYYSGMPIKNRAEEYANKWNSNVFLNNFDEEDENAGINIKLRDIYVDECLPHYIWKINAHPTINLKRLLKKYMIDNINKKMLLILGQPGIGKSTLITWIMANLIENRDEIFVYQFASDLKNINWQGTDILNDVLKTLNLRYDKLENNILILDGFDEIHANGSRERILNQLYQKLKEMSNLKKFTLVITCRENYVYELYQIECDYITLQPWDEKQIKSFCEVYEKKSISIISETKINKILESKEVFGIPLILYMVLALDINIKENKSVVDVYDQIFSLDRSSIYDRCIKDSRYGVKHRISETLAKHQIHQISQRIAFWIFENNSEKAFIPRLIYEDICENMINSMEEGNEDIKRDFLIGNYFKLIKHCEGIGTEELYFIHRSIYEYFVVVYFFQSLHMLVSKEEMLVKLGTLLKDGYLSEQMLEFIKCKFDNMQGQNFPNIVKETFQMMLRDGMTYHLGTLSDVICREMNIFSNMLEIVLLWNPILGELDEKIVIYLRYNTQSKLNLRGIRLRGDIDLPNVYLKEANLEDAYFGRKLYETAHKKSIGIINFQGANLKGANLKGAKLLWTYLVDANLEGANLEGANLLGAELKGANLKKANLKNTIFDERQIKLLHKKYNLINSRVYISRTKEIISYKKYYVVKWKNRV